MALLLGDDPAVSIVAETEVEGLVVAHSTLIKSLSNDPKLCGRMFKARCSNPRPPPSYAASSFLAAQSAYPPPHCMLRSLSLTSSLLHHASNVMHAKITLPELFNITADDGDHHVGPDRGSVCQNAI